MTDIGQRALEANLLSVATEGDPFAAAVLATPMPMVITDPRLPDNPMVFVNDAFCRLTGYPRDQIIGRNCRFLQGRQTDPAHIARIRAAVNAAEPLKIDVRNHRKDGQAFWNRLQITPVRDASFTLIYFLASQTDVTIERDQLEGLESHNAALLAELAEQLRAQRESEARVRFAMGAGRLGIWELAWPGRELSASAVFKQLCGGDPAAQFTYDDLLRAIHPEDRGRAASGLERSFATGADYDLECRVLRPDGVTGWIQARAQIVRGLDGAALRLAGVLLDTTERRLAEQRLALSEQSLRLATEAAEIGTWDLDLATGTLEWSDRAKAIFGIPPAQPYNLEQFYRHLHPEDAGAVRTAFGRALDPAIRAPYETEYRTIDPADAAIRWVAAKGRTLFDDGGHCVRAIGTVIDISARRAAERLAERDRAWRNSQDLLCVVDPAGIIRAANPAWTTLLGWQPDEVIGQLYQTLSVPDDAPAGGAATVVAAMQNQERRVRHRDGSHRWFTWVASDEDGMIYASGRHVTAEKEAAAALARAEEQLRQSQKMEAVGQLTGGIAHDFNNLLTGIMGALELMQRRIDEGRVGDIQRYATVATASAQRASALTQRLLAFARRQPLDPKPLDANHLLAGMEDLLRRTLGPAVALEMRLCDAPWPTLCDLNQLENAILNLAINARDAIAGTGQLIVQTANAEIDAYTAGSPGRGMLPGAYVVISVTDTGCGMHAETLAKVFEPFFTTKPAGQGTGLGLSMLYGFIRQSEGYVRVHSQPGQGTTFRLYLKRHYGAVGPADPKAAPSASLRGRGESILVVDDEPAVRMVVAEVLAELGYAVTEAEDGAAGFHVLQQRADIQLLVTDIGLPAGLNGRELADAARAIRPGLKTLFITGYAGNAAIGAGMLQAGMEILPKPFATAALAAKVRKLLG